MQEAVALARRRGRLALVSSCWWIFGGDAVPESMEGTQAKEIKVATGDLVNRNMSEQEWMARS